MIIHFPDSDHYLFNKTNALNLFNQIDMNIGD